MAKERPSEALHKAFQTALPVVGDDTMPSETLGRHGAPARRACMQMLAGGDTSGNIGDTV